MDDINYEEFLAEALDALYSELGPEQQLRAKAIGTMQTAYVGSPRDKLMDEAFDGLLENAAAARFGKAGKRRALFVFGETGSGKTTAIERHITKRKAFAPRANSVGRLVRPLVAFEAPKPLTLKGLARAGLLALNYDVDPRTMNEQEIFDEWKTQLRENRVLYLWIDELQHVLRDNTTREIRNVADVIKSLVQISGWPLHLILSGVPTLGQFLHQSGGSDGQLSERAFVVELRPLGDPEDLSRVKKIVSKIIGTDAALEVGDVLSDEFTSRIIHACNGGFGSVIEMVRSACVGVFRSGKPIVDNKAFADAYALTRGCRPDENIFTAENWQFIEPRNALGTMLSRAKLLENNKPPEKQAVERPSRAKNKRKPV